MFYSSARYFAGAVIGGSVALTLLFMMQYLIAVGENVTRNTEVFRFLPYVHVKAAEVVTPENEKPERPPAPEIAPSPTAPPEEPLEGPTTALTLPPVDTTGHKPGQKHRPGFVDGNQLPLVKPAPVYPESARRRGLEGHCTVQYTVTAVGTVENPRVVACSNSVFERASIKAARKFKYRPRVIDGQAVAVEGLRNRFTFTLD